MLNVLKSQQSAEESRRAKQLDSPAQQNNYIKKMRKFSIKEKKGEEIMFILNARSNA